MHYTFYSLIGKCIPGSQMVQNWSRIGLLPMQQRSRHHCKGELNKEVSENSLYNSVHPHFIEMDRFSEASEMLTEPESHILKNGIFWKA